MSAEPTSRRQELLDIAATAFAERGFANVTVDELGAAAGISGPALYHHFVGKEALLGEMLVGISERLLADARHQARRPAGLLDRLIRSHCEFAVDNPALITLHYRDLVHVTDAEARRIRRIQSRYVAIWVDAIVATDPQVDATTARAATHAALGLVNSTPYIAGMARDDLVDLLSTMTSAALGAVACERSR